MYPQNRGPDRGRANFNPVIDFSTKKSKSPTPEGILEIPDPQWNLGPKNPKSQNSFEVGASKRRLRPKAETPTPKENDQKGLKRPKTTRGSLVKK